MKNKEKIEWKQIVVDGYKTGYYVSNTGLVYSTKVIK